MDVRNVPWATAQEVIRRALTSSEAAKLVSRKVLEKCVKAMQAISDHPGWNFGIACGGDAALAAARAELERTK